MSGGSPPTNTLREYVSGNMVEFEEVPGFELENEG